jgi:hypothetical protein
MRLTSSLPALAAATVIAFTPAGPALAWGNTGHRMVGTLAMQGLPAEVPAFLRGKQAAADMGELAREPDRWKGSGKTHDSDRDPGHFLDLSDDGTVLGGPKLSALPATRADYETALRAAGADSWKAGYLPYSIIDGYQQLAKDFAYWRVATASAKRKGPHKDWYKADARRREALILRDIGTFAHYVGDGSQPLHVSIHFNGWGPGPNPKGYTNDKVHGPFEGPFVAKYVTWDAARAAMPAFSDCGCPVDQRVEAYLAKTGSYAEPLYQMWGEGQFSGTDPRGAAFASSRVGAGAAELRDLIVLAWRASATASIGYPQVKVADVEAGTADPWIAMLGDD